MSRKCLSKYAVYGDRAAVKAVHKFCVKAFDMAPSRTVEHDPDRWLGQLVKVAGYDPSKFRCMGWVTDLRFDMKRGILFIESSDVDHPQVDAIQVAISAVVDNPKDVRMVYTAVEPYSGIFINTDTKGRVFNERYFVELQNVPIGDDFVSFSRSCVSAREVTSLLGEIFDRNYSSIAECQQLADRVCARSSGFMRVVRFDDV